MTLCPSDTLQDWLGNRNSRISSEAECAGSGVLFEDHAHTSGMPSRAPSSPPPRAASINEELQVPATDDANEDSSPVPLLPADIDSGDGDGDGDGGGKAHHGTPATSPRTDPITSASSGVSYEACSESSSCVSAGDSSSVGGGDGCGEGMRCPPPTRESSRKCERRETVNLEAFGTTAGEVGTEESTKTPTVPSPVRSVLSETESCEGRGICGQGVVDLHEALSLFRQLAEGVSHIHSKGIIHRDIKVLRSANWD